MKKVLRCQKCKLLSNSCKCPDKEKRIIKKGGWTKFTDYFFYNFLSEFFLMVAAGLFSAELVLEITSDKTKSAFALLNKTGFALGVFWGIAVPVIALVFGVILKINAEKERKKLRY